MTYTVDVPPAATHAFPSESTAIPLGTLPLANVTVNNLVMPPLLYRNFETVFEPW